METISDINSSERLSAERPLRVPAGRDGHGPVVLGDAGPVDPDHDDGEEGEEGFEEGAVDLGMGGEADVDADDVLEDLADGEKEGGGEKIDWWWGSVEVIGMFTLGAMKGLVREREKRGRDSRIGFFSPSTLRTRKVSRRKKPTKNTSGASW